MSLRIIAQERSLTERIALTMAVREMLVAHWRRGTDIRSSGYSRVVAYLSAEFLLGPHLHNNLIALGIYSQVESA